MVGDVTSMDKVLESRRRRIRKVGLTSFSPGVRELHKADFELQEDKVDEPDRNEETIFTDSMKNRVLEESSV